MPGALITPAMNLGLGGVKVDFGAECRVRRRGMGKAGYCNYQLASIAAMRELGKQAADNLKVPPVHGMCEQRVCTERVRRGCEQTGASSATTWQVPRQSASCRRRTPCTPR